MGGIMGNGQDQENNKTAPQTANPPTPPELTTEQLNLHLEMGKLYFEQFNKRRDFQWKVNLSYWGVIAIVIGFSASKGMISTISEDSTLRFLIHLSIFVPYIWWRSGLERSNSIDKFRALKHMDKIVNDDNFYEDCPKRFPMWSPYSECLMTLILLVISFYTTGIPLVIAAVVKTTP